MASITKIGCFLKDSDRFRQGSGRENFIVFSEKNHKSPFRIAQKCIIMYGDTLCYVSGSFFGSLASEKTGGFF
jgi:hypothetical protein